MKIISLILVILCLCNCKIGKLQDMNEVFNSQNLSSIEYFELVNNQSEPMPKQEYCISYGQSISMTNCQLWDKTYIKSNFGDNYTDSLDTFKFANIRGISAFQDSLTILRSNGLLVAYFVSNKKTEKYTNRSFQIPGNNVTRVYYDG